jgi:hypothetical protein
MSEILLSNWHFESFESFVTGKWRLRLVGENTEGKVKQTSAIVEVDSARGLVHTYSGSTYLLAGKTRGSNSDDLTAEIEKKLRLAGKWEPAQRQGPI